MHRFLVEPGAIQRDLVALDPAESRHAAVVLRLRSGDAVTLLDGDGTVAEGVVMDATPKRVDVAVRTRTRVPARRGEVIVAAALTKGKAWDWTLQKATELGAAGIVALETRRSVVRIAAADAADRRLEWRRVAIEAAKQCGTPWLPRIDGPVPLERWLKAEPVFDLGLVAALAPGTTEIGPALDQKAGVRRVAIVIGPEGDLEPAELDALLGAGFLPVTLGPTVLRAETAATVAVGLVSYLLRQRVEFGPVTDAGGK